MVKKAKEKTDKPVPGSSNAAKDGAKGKKSQKAEAPPAAAPPAGPPKPTVKQIIGGFSWTGKLPVNLLSEYCQKQRWEKPDYDTRKTPEGFSVWVTLGAKDAKTQQHVRLDPFKIPPSHKHLLLRDTALEAKHAAATYALFRVCSMQNKHTVLPPDHKSLWKEFQALKAQDVKDGRGWMYDSDPFKTLLERQEAKAAAEKKRKEAEAAKAKAKDMPGASGLVLMNSASPGAASNPMKGWTSAPKVEMGRQTRARLEALLRRGISWNPHGIRMSAGQKDATVADFATIGFRRSHVEEAVEYCKDREETLEWLLIHVPEDDLPRWAMPESYSAGISVGATNLKREGIIKSLAEPGYSLELCARVLDSSRGDQGKAAEALQEMLYPSTAGGSHVPDSGGVLDLGTPEEQWEEEVASLESMLGDGFRREDDEVIRIRLEAVANAQDPRQGEMDAYLQIRRPSSYPQRLILAVIAKLPSYIKLSIVKKALAYQHESLQDEPMKIYLIMDWVQQNMKRIIDNPGKLVDISAVSSAAAESCPKPVTKSAGGRRKPAKTIDWTPDAHDRETWLRRQQSAAWRDMESKRQRLPAWPMRDGIVRTVKENDISIISGETGSGKSTQSVQFILDDLYEDGLGRAANMIVTQPRRISALGLADRVAEERCTRVGGEVGYAIRGESRTSKDTRITFVTTGVLLRRLQTGSGRAEDVAAALADVSHVVIDEVHERSLDADFLLTLLREVMKTRRGMLKLILMSATLDAATFKHYFASEGLSVGSIEIEGRTFPVDDYYLDDVIRMTRFKAEGGDRGLAADDTTGRAIQKLGHGIHYGLLAEAVKAVDRELSDEDKAGGILVFLPGVGEINQACGRLRELRSLHVVPLHASLETREQKKAFARAPAGKRKVVVATNVAETSITIDDVVAVIDSGRVKETSLDAEKGMRKLEETWASRAACKQRRGRAGRVRRGKCYKLYTQRLEQQMAERPEPEMRRVPLEQLCLSVRAMGMRDVGAFLGRAPTAPDARAIEGTMRLLRHMGALDGEELTAMGQQLAMLPADLRCGKLMVLGAMLGCLDDCVTMAAVLSTRSPFVSPPDKREAARAARMRFSTGDGDLVTDLDAFQQWEAMARDGVPPRQMRALCDESFLSWQALSDISGTRAQYYAALAEAGLVEAGRAAGGGGAASRDPRLLRALLAAAFAPQIARIQYPDRKYASSMSGAVELDPEARAIKYFTQENGRVFLHPGSTLFGSQGFPDQAAYLSYFGIMSTSKVFIRDVTRELDPPPFSFPSLSLCSLPIRAVPDRCLGGGGEGKLPGTDGHGQPSTRTRCCSSAAPSSWTRWAAGWWWTGGCGCGDGRASACWWRGCGA